MATVKRHEKRDKTEKMLSARSQLLNILFIVLILTATLIFLFNSFYDPDHPLQASYFHNLKWWWFLPALACMLLSIGCETGNLWILCRAVGYRRSPRQTLVYASSDIYFSAITPSATGGQPAAAYYMTKSGMPLSLSTAVLILNVTLYTFGLLAISAIAFIMNPSVFIREFDALQKICVLVGMGFHALLIVFCLVCMFSKRFVYLLGDMMFGLLAKLHIVKNKEERIAAYRSSVATYQAALGIVRQNRWLLPALFFNALMQRVILAPITYFVCLAIGIPGVSTASSFAQIFATQLYCTVGASAIPLPGGVGIAETLYIGMFDSLISGASIASNENLCMFSMLLSRSFSSYFSIIFCGVITITHHVKMKRAEYNRRRMAPPFDSLTGTDDADDPLNVPAADCADGSATEAKDPDSQNC
jgi:hypothetical protein